MTHQRLSQSHARLAAVQALFQMEQSEQSLNSVLDDFKLSGSAGLDESGQPMPDTDQDLFCSLVSQTVSRQTHIDNVIRNSLAPGWRIERIDTISRAILRTAVCEFLVRPDVPRAVIIDEYVWLAGSFLDAPQTGFINGVADTVSRHMHERQPTAAPRS